VCVCTAIATAMRRYADGRLRQQGVATYTKCLILYFTRPKVLCVCRSYACVCADYAVATAMRHYALRERAVMTAMCHYVRVKCSCSIFLLRERCGCDSDASLYTRKNVLFLLHMPQKLRAYDSDASLRERSGYDNASLRATRTRKM